MTELPRNPRVHEHVHVLVLWGLITSPKCPDFAGEVCILGLSVEHLHEHEHEHATNVPALPQDKRNIYSLEL